MATYSLGEQIYQKFLGIREVNGINSQSSLSAIKANNVEFYQSEIGNCVGVKTQKGREIYFSLPDVSLKCLKCWESIQKVNESDRKATSFIFIYAENETVGQLYCLKPTRITPYLIINSLTVTGECNGLTLVSSAYDVFIFTNGVEQKTVSFGREAKKEKLVKSINAVDYLKRSISWLGMTEWKGFLVVASPYGVHASHQNDIYTWNDNPKNVADSWYIDYSNTVTAVASSQSGLFIFTKRSVDFLNTTPNDVNNSYKATVALNGTMSYSSWCVHDRYLFFYDPIQKNIYYFFINDSNQIQIAGAMALEIQSEFQNVKDIEFTSCIYGGFNQIWVLINKEKLLIFDYLTKEWVKRSAQAINSVTYINNYVLVCGQNANIYQENINYKFDNTFYPSEYKTMFINLGSNTDLKKQKTPILLVLNDKYVNNFYIELTVNGKYKNPKHIYIIARGQASYAEEEASLIVNEEEKFNLATYADDETYHKRVVEISTPQTWYNLGLRIYTNRVGQGFCIDSLEIKNIKAKTKTKGR